MSKNTAKVVSSAGPPSRSPFRLQLLKWVGNKQRFAHEIAGYFPAKFRTYHEPFLGSGAVLATVAPGRAVAADSFQPLIDIFRALQARPSVVQRWYTQRWRRFQSADRATVYARIRDSYNRRPNAADLLFLSRSCYGGVVRFRKADGYMSTPCGVHNPISPESFAERVAQWHRRVAGTRFEHREFVESLLATRAGDLVYCDPPYSHSQNILYGAQSFRLEHLIEEIARCKSRGVRVALSVDGSKKSGRQTCELPIPRGLFEREVFVNCGRSMLRRFQMRTRTLEGEVVADRLLLTY